MDDHQKSVPVEKPKEIMRINVAQFREFGFLQELNRQYLHPLGMALEVCILGDGKEIFGGIWDYRDDPEGIIFGPGVIDPEKATRVKAFAEKRHAERREALGFVVQPADPPGTRRTIKAEWWLCGRIVGEEDENGRRPWDYQGIFSSEARAVAACRDATYFIAPVAPPDEQLPHESITNPRSYYPKSNHVEPTGTCRTTGGVA